MPLQRRRLEHGCKARQLAIAQNSRQCSRQQISEDSLQGQAQLSISPEMHRICGLGQWPPAYMFGFIRRKNSKEDPEHRYYLLPGMGRSNRRQRQRIQLWSIIAGILGSALIGAALWLLNR